MRKKILIVEDSPTVLGMLKDVFENEGYNVLPAETGEDGVKMAKSDKPDLVIIDTVLPGIDGFEVCRKIKSEGASRAAKIIIITGNVDAVDAEKALDSGADDYCAKTSDFSNLVAAIKKLA
ncbi:MAG: response regulator [Candidatus Omnitrophica bacterium]|nr:response regulator [Candidatus Omnitrophota bacterium]